MRLDAIRYAPGLIITPAFQNFERGLKTLHYWTVTHEPTGYRISSNDLPKRYARYVAGILAELPIDWTGATQDEFFKAFGDVPQSVKDIVFLLRKSEA